MQDMHNGFDEETRKLVQKNYFDLFDLYNDENVDTDNISVVKKRIQLLNQLLDLDYKKLEYLSQKERDEAFKKNSEKEDKENTELVKKLNEIMDNIDTLKDDEGVIYHKTGETYDQFGNKVKYIKKILYKNNKLLFTEENENTSYDVEITESNAHIYSQYINEIYAKIEQNGGRMKVYKLTDKKVTIIYKNKPITRNIYVNKSTKTKYCKINKQYILLSKLKKAKI